MYITLPLPTTLINKRIIYAIAIRWLASGCWGGKVPQCWSTTSSVSLSTPSRWDAPVKNYVGVSLMVEWTQSLQGLLILHVNRFLHLVNRNWLFLKLTKILSFWIDEVIVSVHVDFFICWLTPRHLGVEDKREWFSVLVF